MDCSRTTLYRHQETFAIIILFFSLKVLISFYNLNSEGRSSSPVGYGIGIAEVVGSNPTRSTINSYQFLLDLKGDFFLVNDLIFPKNRSASWVVPDFDYFSDGLEAGAGNYGAD